MVQQTKIQTAILSEIAKGKASHKLQDKSTWDKMQMTKILVQMHGLTMQTNIP